MFLALPGQAARESLSFLLWFEASLKGQRTKEKPGRKLCAVPLFSVPDQLALQLSAARPHPPPLG